MASEGETPQQVAKRAAEYLAQGNASFTDGDEETALKCYDQALKLAPGDKRIYLNRANLLTVMHKFEAALNDATCAIHLDQTHPKSWYRLACALTGLEEYSRAAVAFNKVMTLDPTNKEAYEALQKLRIQQLFHPVTKDLGVSVMYVNPVKRRGLFVRRKHQRNETLFTEFPIVSLQSRSTSGKFRMCGHCMRALTTDNELLASFLHPDLVELVGKLTDHISYKWPHNPDKERFCCPHCEEQVYCSEECREKDWKGSHSVLCVGKNGEAVKKWRKFLDEKISDPNLCVYLEMLEKMCAQVLTETRETKSLAIAWDRFGYFADRKDPLLTQEQYDKIAELLTEVCRDEEHDIKLSGNFVWTKLGQLVFNMQFIEPSALAFPKGTPVPLPVSLWQESKYAPLQGKYAQVAYSASKESKEDDDGNKVPVQETQTMVVNIAVTEKPRCVALYKLQSCVNHSCAPTITVENYETCEAVACATTDLDMGDEVCSSYVDSSVPWNERKELLKWYQFECTCGRCEDERTVWEHMERKKMQSEEQKAAGAVSAEELE